MKIRIQLLLVVGGVALLPLFLAAWVLYHESATRLQKQADATLLAYAQRIAAETDGFVFHAVDSIRRASAMPSLIDYLSADTDARVQLHSRVIRVLRDVIIPDPVNVSSAVVFDRAGEQVLDTAESSRAAGPIVADVMREVIANGVPAVRSMFPDYRSPGIWVCGPVRTPNGEVLGAVGVWYELPAVQKYVAAHSPTPTTSTIAAIVDDQWRFIAHAESPELVGIAGPTQRPPAGEASWGRWSPAAASGEPDRVAAIALTHAPWTLVVATPAAVFNQASSELQRTLGGLALLVVGLSVAAAMLAARWLSRPIMALADAAERLGRGEHDVRMPIGGKGEVGTLARTLDVMQRQLADTLRTLEQRVADVRRSEQRLHQLVDAAPIAMILANVRDGTHEINGMVTKLLGYTTRDMPNREAWFARAYPDPVYRKHVEEALAAHMEAPVPPGGVPPPFEAFVTCRDGSQRLIEFYISKVGDFLDIALFDLTERRRAELALRESEEKFSKAFRSTPDAICISDAQTMAIIDVNAGFESLFEWSPTQAVGRTALELGLWADENDRQRMKTVLEHTRQVRNFEAQGRTRSGAFRTCLVSAEVTEIGGRPRVIHAVHDVTDRVTTENARRASEEQVRLLLAHAPEAIVVFDVDAGHFVSANPAAEKLFGLSEAELFTLSPIDLSPERQPDGRTSVEAAREYLASALAGGRPVFEWTHRHADGRDLACEIRLLRLPDPQRQLLRGSIIDLSERKRTERALRTMAQGTAGVIGQAFFDATVAELARGIGVHCAFIGEISRDGMRVRFIASWNQEALTPGESPLQGTPAAELMHQPFVHVAEGLRARFPDDGVLARTNAESFLGTQVRDASGAIVGIVAVLDDKPMPDSEAARLLLAISASRVAAEILRQRANEDLERRVHERTAQLAAANAELEAFSYSVSHDLRGPLRVIDGFARALREDLGEKLDETTRGHLERIRAGAQRMGALIDDLLRLSRASRAEMKPEPIDLATLADAVVNDLRQRQPEREVTFHCQRPLPAVGDRALVRILLENLLDNAWKYTRRQPVARVVLETVRAPEGASAPTFVVRDNGAGFDMRYAGKLFAPFQRLHTPAEFEGTGVGLATVRRIAARHGGTTWAESAVGQGSSFYFTLSAGAPPVTL